MALDGIILHKECLDLKRRLPMRINRITQVSQNEIVFNVHTERKRTNLIISCHSLYNRIHITDKDYTGYDEPSGFIMLLRKHILNGIIEEIIQEDYDRYLILKIRALDDLYDEKHYTLHVELMGKYANIILVDNDGKVMDALKRIPPFENNKRTIWPGAIFTYPEKQIKHDPFKVFTYDSTISLVKQFKGFSPLLAKEIEYRLSTQSFEAIMQEINESDKIYIANTKDTYECHVIPLLHLGLNFKVYEINNGFDYIYFSLEEKERIKHVTGDLNKLTKRQIKHFETKLIKLNESLEEAYHCDDLRDCGDLLYTYSNLNLKGLKEVEVVDYNDNQIKISLDPKLSIKENANKYYTNYQKKRKSQKYLLEQIDITQNELDYFNSINEQLIIANYNDAMMIKDDLVKNGYLKLNQKKKKVKKKELLHLYQIKYKTHTVTFGKNNIQNETLTFHYAKNNYTWFHAQKFHGAHLCVDTNEPDEDTIRFCANLAAYYSNGRYSSSVPVDYCLVKDIKKIKGSKAGLVSISNYKTIFIDPEFDENLSFIAI